VTSYEQPLPAGLDRAAKGALTASLLRDRRSRDRESIQHLSDRCGFRYADVREQSEGLAKIVHATFLVACFQVAPAESIERPAYLKLGSRGARQVECATVELRGVTGFWPVQCEPAEVVKVFCLPAAVVTELVLGSGQVGQRQPVVARGVMQPSEVGQ
jgi:hypothetical protein